jgi:hypothetical protein
MFTMAALVWWCTTVLILRHISWVLMRLEMLWRGCKNTLRNLGADMEDLLSVVGALVGIIAFGLLVGWFVY